VGDHLTASARCSFSWGNPREGGWIRARVRGLRSSPLLPIVKDRHCVYLSAHVAGVSNQEAPPFTGAPTGFLISPRSKGCPHVGAPVRLATEGSQTGSLSGAEHPLHRNADVLRLAQRGQKPRVEYKGKSKLDGTGVKTVPVRKHGLEILCASFPAQLDQWCRKNYHRDNWLVAP